MRHDGHERRGHVSGDEDQDGGHEAEESGLGETLFVVRRRRLPRHEPPTVGFVVAVVDDGVFVVVIVLSFG